MTSRRSIDENFALQALSMSQHIVAVSPDPPPEGHGSADSSSAAQTITVGERLSVLSRRAAQLADAAVDAEREVELAEAEFESQRNIVNMHAEALAAAQRAANEAQLLLQVRKGEYEEALQSAHAAHLEYGDFFRTQTQFMFASKASISARRPSLSGSAPSHSPVPSTSAAGPSSDAVASNSNKRPRLSSGASSSRAGGAGRGSGTRRTSASLSAAAGPTGVSDADAGEGLVNGSEADNAAYSTRSSSSARGARGGLKRAEARSSTSRTLPSANLQNEALATAPPYFRSSSSASSSSTPGTSSTRTAVPSAPTASLARQLLRAKATGTENPGSSSTSAASETTVAAAESAQSIVSNTSTSEAQTSPDSRQDVSLVRLVRQRGNGKRAVAARR